MVQNNSVLKVADNTGAKFFKVITVLGGSRKRFGHVGDIVSGVVHKASSGGTVKDHQKAHGVVVRTRKEYRRVDGTYIKFDENAVVLVDKNNEPIGTSVFGPVAREVKERGFAKVASLAPEML
jgi:large subunit ribosomal protein L14